MLHGGPHVGTGAEVIHYVRRRVAQNRAATAVAFDELEWLGRYLVDSLELIEMKHVDAGHEVAITGHTVDLSSYYLFKSGVRHTPVERPVHKLPASLSRLLRDMERSGTFGWTQFAIALLDLPRELQDKFERDFARAIARGHSCAFVCRTTNRTLEVWAKVGPDTVLAPQARTDALQIVLEFTTSGTLLQALELGSNKRVAFASGD